MKKIRSRRTRIIYILLGFIVIVLLGAVIFWQPIKYRLISRKIHSAVSDKSSGLYRLDYKNLVIDEVAGNLSVESVHLLTDSLTWEKQSRDSSRQLTRMDIRIPKLFITGVKTPKALLNKEIEGQSIRIDSAVFTLTPAKSRNSKAVPDETLVTQIYNQVLGNLKSVKADSLVLRNITIIIRDPETGHVKFNGSGFSVILSDILVDSAHQGDSSRILFSKEVAIRCRDLTLDSKDKKYKYIFSGMDYSSLHSSLRIAAIRVQPLLSESDFAAAYKYSKDRLDFHLEDISIQRISRNALFSQRLIADTLLIKKSSFKIFRDISHPHDSADRTEAYPQLALMKLDMDINIHRLILENSYIEYKEKNAKSDSSGKLQFYNVRAVFSNVTNIAAVIQANNKLGLDFRARFLNKASFHAVITMILKNPEGLFTLDANLGPMNATFLNPMLEPMALAKIDHGNIQSLNYHLEADKTHGIGKLTFLYSDIRVILLKKDETQNKYKTKVLPTLAAGLLVKNSNPANGDIRTPTIDFTRDRHRSIFHLMWKSMFMAVKETAGMK